MKPLFESSLFEFLNGSVLPAALVDCVIKGLVLLALLGLIALGLRKISASARHGIWLAGLVSVLVLPLLTLGLPGWSILPDAWSPAVKVPKTAVTPSLKSGGAAVGKSANVILDPPDSPPAIGSENPALVAASAVSPAVIRADGNGSSDSNNITLSMRQWIALIWVAGAALLAARLWVSRWGVARLARRTRRVTGGYLEDELRELCARLGIRRRVVLLLSQQRAIPMTWGILRPRILLPSEVANWEPEKRRAVLLHELAHVARWDCLSQLIGQITLVFHWFNPLVWVAVRRLAIEQEHACDDRVIGGGIDPPDYAELILNLSAAFPVPRFWGANAVAMAKSAGLEKRLRGILDPDRNRRSPGLRAVIAGAGCLVLILCPLAMIQADDKKEKRGGGPDRPNPDRVPTIKNVNTMTTELEGAFTSTELVRPPSDGRSGVAIFGKGGAVFEVQLNREGSLRVRFPDADIRHPNPNSEEFDRIHLRSVGRGETVFLTVDDRGRGASVMTSGVVRGDSDSMLVEDRRRSESKVELIRGLDQLRQAVAPHISNPSSLQIDLTDLDGGDIEDVLELLRNPQSRDELDQLYRELAEELAKISKRLDEALAGADNKGPRVLEDSESADDRKRLDAWHDRNDVTTKLGGRGPDGLTANTDVPFDKFAAEPEQLAGDAVSANSGFPPAVAEGRLARADPFYRLSFPLAGIVRDAPVKAGTEISKGQVLLQLDDRRAGNDLAIAKQQLDLAKANLELKTVEYKGAQDRLELLKAIHSKNQASTAELRQSERKVATAGATLKVAEAELAMAASQLSQAEITVQQHRILAPVDGTVERIDHKPGEYADAGVPAVVLRASPGKKEATTTKGGSGGRTNAR